MIWKISFSGLNKNTVLNQLFSQYMKEFQEKYPLECKNDKISLEIIENALLIHVDDKNIAAALKKDLKSFKTKTKLLAMRPLGFKSEIIE